MYSVTQNIDTYILIVYYKNAKITSRISSGNDDSRVEHKQEIINVTNKYEVDKTISSQGPFNDMRMFKLTVVYICDVLFSTDFYKNKLVS